MNKKSIKKKLLVCVCLVAVLLTGCGGKSGSESHVKVSGKYEIFLLNPGNTKYYIAGNSIIQVCHAENKIVNEMEKLTYDERGNWLHHEKSYAGGYESKAERIYDDENHLIEQKSVYGDYAPYQVHSIKYKYENDQISEWIEYLGESSDGEAIDEDTVTSEEYKLSYNEKGQLESAVSGSKKIKYTYNEEGFLEKREDYDIVDGKEILHTDWLYNGNSQYWYDSQLSSIIDYDEEGNVNSTKEYKSACFYIENGIITPKEGELAGTITSTSTTYEMYGGEPVATQSKWYLADGQEALSMDYATTDMDNEEAGAASNNISYATCDENGRVSERWNNGDYRDFKYDDKGNLISRTLYREDGKPIWYQRSEYDKNNNLIIEKLLPVAKILSGRVNIYEYDDHNQPISYKSYRVEDWEDSDLESDLASSSIDVSKLELFDHEEYVNEYDSNGNRISCTTKYILKGKEESDEDDLIHVYSYDKDGRVIKEEIAKAGEEEADTMITWEYFD